MKNNVTANDIARGLLAKLPRLKWSWIEIDGEVLRNASPKATLDELAEIALTDLIAEICGDPEEAPND